MVLLCSGFFFFFNDTATTEIYTLSLHDALPICPDFRHVASPLVRFRNRIFADLIRATFEPCLSCLRSEEHTSELQSQSNLVCRLLLEKKKKPYHKHASTHSMTPSHIPTATPRYT